MIRARVFSLLLCCAVLPPLCRAQAAQSATPAAQPQLVLLDTDIGDDIDDAFALSMLVNSPEVKLLGITTTYGDTELRGRLLDRYLKAAHRADIPVAVGPRSKQNNMFSQSAYAQQAPERAHPDGVKFMLDSIRAHPGEVTLIAIGPLVTVEAAIGRDPATFRKLKRVVMMGGSVYRGYGAADAKPIPEWNIQQGIAGAKALLASGVPIYMMPLDSTQVHLPWERALKLFAYGSPVTDQLTLLYFEWLENAGNHAASATLFDPVAATYAIRPEFCPAQPLHIEVDDKGMTVPTAGKPNVNVCLKVDEAGFLDFLLGRIAPPR
jgi:inosine-uridine nucleoside N-ribohydrolase